MSQQTNEPIAQDAVTLGEVYRLVKSVESTLNERVLKLESWQTWVGRSVLFIVLCAVVGTVIVSP